VMQWQVPGLQSEPTLTGAERAGIAPSS
jgi:hypothetical protein